MKKISLGDIVSVLLLLLFTYTATSKFLDYNKFVFQMKLAPLPLMSKIAPILGWLIPVLEAFIAIALAGGIFVKSIQIKALFASIILLSTFQLYITAMLLSGSQLPCTCGGIISTLGWKQHLFFNMFFIVTGILSIKFLRQHRSSLVKKVGDQIKILSRA